MISARATTESTIMLRAMGPSRSVSRPPRGGHRMTVHLNLNGGPPGGELMWLGQGHDYDHE